MDSSPPKEHINYLIYKYIPSSADRKSTTNIYSSRTVARRNNRNHILALGIFSFLVRHCLIYLFIASLASLGGSEQQ